MKKISLLLITLMTSGLVMAKLPAPSPEAAAAAALAKAKKAHAGKVGAYKLCLAQNNVASRYQKAGTPAPAACTNPGPFVAPAATK
jgi:hypothetical protein